jgi:hypothetical protein
VSKNGSESVLGIPLAEAFPSFHRLVVAVLAFAQSCGGDVYAVKRGVATECARRAWESGTKVVECRIARVRICEALRYHKVLGSLDGLDPLLRRIHTAIGIAW